MPSSKRKSERPETPPLNGKKVKSEPNADQRTPSKSEQRSPGKPLNGTPVKGTPLKSATKRANGVKEEEQEVHKWWEEDNGPSAEKWKTLSHNGPRFAPPYERLPSSVRFIYNGTPYPLEEAAEEVALAYAKMLDHDFTKEKTFNENFFKDWRKQMTPDEKGEIKQLDRCDFRELHAHHQKIVEERKARGKEEKQAEKVEKEEQIKHYGWCLMDSRRERIGNYNIEPPGLFRGRGKHPKMGRWKERVRPEQVTVNCSRDVEPPKPPPGHKWYSVAHDNKVTWLALWKENVNGAHKYVMLNQASRLKGEKDLEKYEKARMLHQRIEHIRKCYEADLHSKNMAERQRAVAMYFIDRLALRAGNEKGDDAADTVGCCSLRVEHMKTLHENDKYFVELDFLGKDSIRYFNKLSIPKQVYKSIQKFMDNKKKSDDLFDRLDTSKLNAHLQTLMPGLTAKVFRTYNASVTLERQLELLMKNSANASVHEKVLQYNRANREVAILCNHQKAVSKVHDTAMQKLDEKLQIKKDELRAQKEEYKTAKDNYRKSADGSSSEASARTVYERAKKKKETIEDQIRKLENQKVDKDENKTISLGTSKLNYLDPRISVAWCMKYDVPLTRVYSKTHQQKFKWAIDMTKEDFKFCEKPKERKSVKAQPVDEEEGDEGEEEDDEEEEEASDDEEES